MNAKISLFFALLLMIDRNRSAINSPSVKQAMESRIMNDFALLSIKFKQPHSND